MTYRLALPLLALLAATACSRDEPAPAAGTADATAPAATPVSAAPAAAPALDPAAQAAVTQIAATAATAPAPVAGTDYAEISNGQPFEPLDGKIEVVEIFGYTCGHCATFQPLMSAWKASLPADVRVTYVPAPFGGYWIPYAKAYYAAEALGVVEASHDAVFRAVHLERSLPVQPLPSNEQLGQFHAQFGADPKVFASTMDSFAVNGKLNRAKQFIQRSFGSDTPGTPALVVNGKYRVTGKSLEEHLRIAQQLIERERSAAPATTAPAAGAPTTDASPTAAPQQ
jgi:thiol:disulfide interchange protein DsbA